MKPTQLLSLLAVLGAGAASGASQAGPERAPWHGDDGPLVRADGTSWRPELVLELDFPRMAQPQACRAAVPFDGAWVELDLVPYSLRTDDFRLVVADAQGIPSFVAAPPPRTYRGTVVGRDDVRVTASLDAEGRLSAMLESPTSVWYVQPLDEYVPGSGPRSHAVFSWLNLPSSPGRCGVDDLEGVPGGVEMGAQGHGRERDPGHSPSCGPACGHSHGGAEPSPSPLGGDDPLVPYSVSYKAGRIAIHARSDYYNWAGNDVASVTANIEALLNEVQREYDEGPHLDPFKFNLCGIFFEDNGPDLTTSDDKDQLLCDLKGFWANNGYWGFDPDFVHLLTTELGPGSTTGYASTGVTCTTLASCSPSVSTTAAFGISETDFSIVMKFRAWLTAHELGHNFGAVHDGCGAFQDTCQIMCPTIDVVGCGLIGISWSETAANAVNGGMGSCFDGANGTVYADASSSFPFPDGTATLPFKTVSSALPHVSSGWTLALYASTFTESPLLLSEPMTLTAVNGPAKIQ